MIGPHSDAANVLDRIVDSIANSLSHHSVGKGMGIDRNWGGMLDLRSGRGPPTPFLDVDRNHGLPSTLKGLGLVGNILKPQAARLHRMGPVQLISGIGSSCPGRQRLGQGVQALCGVQPTIRVEIGHSLAFVTVLCVKGSTGHLLTLFIRSRESRSAPVVVCYRHG